MGKIFALQGLYEKSSGRNFPTSWRNNINVSCMPHSEAWQAVMWNMLVIDPRILAMSNKWESLEGKKFI